jgi:hypothetical protein
MTSKLILTTLTAGLLLGASTGAMAADAKPKAPSVTPAVYKSLALIGPALAKADYAAAQAAVDAARQVPGRKPYDDLKIDEFAMSIKLKQNDLAGADVEAEAAADLDPASIPDEEKAQVYKTALQLALNAKRYDNSAKYAKLFMALTPPPTGPDLALATEALFRSGDYAGATAIAQKNIDAAVAAGQKPARNDLEITMAAQAKQKDEPGAEKTLELLVANYSMPEDWDQIMGIALTQRGMRDIDYIYMGRLMQLQGGKIKAADAQLVGSAANSNKLGLYGDADAMQKFGGPAADPREAADKKSLPKQIADGAKNDGEYNVKTAEAAYGYGQYADAEKLARTAKTKPGVKDPTEPDMVIGISLAAQGKYAEAAAVFDSIKQSNPPSARVVRLWGYFAKSKANPATAAAK